MCPDSGAAPNVTFTREVNAYTGSDAWQQLDASGRRILSVDQDDEANDQADAINARLRKDGGNFNADMDIQGNKFTNVEDASARTHYASAGQVADSSLAYAGTSAGTDTITATLTPAITAYVEGQKYHFKAGGTNTGAATINFNSVGAKSVKKGADGATALAAGDITTGGTYSVIYDGTNFQLENPGTQNRTITTFGASLIDDADATTARTTLGLGTIATQNASSVAITGGSIAGITDLAVADGGTGAGTAAGARTNLGAVLSDAVFPGAIVAIIEDQKTSGTDGGTFSAGADRTRTLNTLVYNRNSAVSLSSNQFTLPAGNWEISWEADAYLCDLHQSLLYDVTGTAEIKRGKSSFSNDTGNGSLGPSSGCTVVSLALSNAYEIRHRCSNTATFGQASSFGTEVYCRVIIRAA